MATPTLIPFPLLEKATRHDGRAHYKLDPKHIRRIDSLRFEKRIDESDIEQLQMLKGLKTLELHAGVESRKVIEALAPLERLKYLTVAPLPEDAWPAVQSLARLESINVAVRADLVWSQLPVCAYLYLEFLDRPIKVNLTEARSLKWLSLCPTDLEHAIWLPPSLESLEITPFASIRPLDWDRKLGFRFPERRLRASCLKNSTVLGRLDVNGPTGFITGDIRSQLSPKTASSWRELDAKSFSDIPRESTQLSFSTGDSALLTATDWQSFTQLQDLTIRIEPELSRDLPALFARLPSTLVKLNLENLALEALADPRWSSLKRISVLRISASGQIPHEQIEAFFRSLQPRGWTFSQGAGTFTVEEYDGTQWQTYCTR